MNNLLNNLRRFLNYDVVFLVTWLVLTDSWNEVLPFNGLWHFGIVIVFSALTFLTMIKFITPPCRG